MKAVKRAARQALDALLEARVDAAVAAGHDELTLDARGRLLHGEEAVLAHVIAGERVLEPRVRMPRHEMLTTGQREALRRRAQQWVRAEVERLTAPLDSEGLHGAAAGLLYRLGEGLGTLPREAAAEQVAALSPGDRKALYRRGVRLGVHAVYAVPLLKPDQVARRAWLWGVAEGASPLPSPPPPGATSAPTPEQDAPPPRFYGAVGYRLLGPRVVRVDMVERLDARLREVTRRGAGPLPAAEGMSWLGCSAAELIGVCRALGYEAAGEDEAATLQRPRRRRRGPKRGRSDR